MSEVEAIERVAAAINGGSSLLEAFSLFKVPLPNRRKISGSTGSMLLIFTDLEPDDVIAIACMLQRPDVVAAPVIVFSSLLQSKDSRGIFGRKLAMATAALGEEFVEELIVLPGDGSPPPAAFSGGTFDAAATKAVLRAAQGYLSLEVLIMAPGNGGIAQLLKALKASSSWDSVAQSTTIQLYSGSYNIRGSREEDIAAIDDMVRTTGGELQDTAHFVWTQERKFECLQDLQTILPTLEEDLGKSNPYFLAAWRHFAMEFNADIVSPGSKRFWEKDTVLTPEEEALFEQAKALHKDGLVKEYCEKIKDNKALLSKVVKFKQNIIVCLAEGRLQGPLCDCLLFLNMWAHRSKPSMLTLEKRGAWVVNFDSGFTGVEVEGKLCKAVQPRVADDVNNEAAKEFGQVLLKTVLDAVSLKKRGRKSRCCFPFLR